MRPGMPAHSKKEEQIVNAHRMFRENSAKLNSSRAAVRGFDLKINQGFVEHGRVAPWMVEFALRHRFKIIWVQRRNLLKQVALPTSSLRPMLDKLHADNLA